MSEPTPEIAASDSPEGRVRLTFEGTKGELLDLLRQALALPLKVRKPHRPRAASRRPRKKHVRARHLETVQARHRQVEKDEVGMELLRDPQCLRSVRCLADRVAPGREQQSQRASGIGVVLHDEHTQRRTREPRT